MTINYKASPIGAKVSEDKRSLWGSSKLVVEVVHVSHLVNHLLVCKAGKQWLGMDQWTGINNVEELSGHQNY